MSHGRGGCDRQTLAVGPVSKIEKCAGCDQIHVHLGALSVRLEVEAFQALLLSMLEAADALDSSTAERLLS